MVRIAPIRLSFDPKTLWFNAENLELAMGDKVVVETARGNEFGSLCGAVFEMPEEEARETKAKTPLKPVKRLATDEDCAQNDEMARLSIEAMPTFRRLAAETTPDMNPVAVEYLFDGDKAVFYFESEERIDFRELVRKLASEFHVRIDMKQIGVRDSARMIGGIGHCGQELCCRRLGGEFNPVSIRMAKEQDLSLNPGKISGLCGRLMCCLRYEYDAYKDFHSRAPKKNAKIETPEGEGKVVDLDVPREIVSIKVGDEKPVKIPLSSMEPVEEGARPNAVGEEAWEAANEPPSLMMDSAFGLFSNHLSGDDQLAKPGQVRHVHEEEAPVEQKPSRRSRRSRNTSSADSPKTEQTPTRKPRRRRSMTVTDESDVAVEQQPRTSQAQKPEAETQKQAETRPKSSSRRRSRNRSGNKAQDKPVNEQKRSVQVGRNSSALRANRGDASSSSSAEAAQQANRKLGQGGRRRRRSHSSSQDSTSTGNQE